MVTSRVHAASNKASTLNPERPQLIRLMAVLALIRCFFKNNLMITRRKYSENRGVRSSDQEGLGVPDRSRRIYNRGIGGGTPSLSIPDLFDPAEVQSELCALTASINNLVSSGVPSSTPVILA